MSTLKRQEPVGAGLRRIACTHVEAAIRCLTRQPGQASTAVQGVQAADAMLTLLEPELTRSMVRRDRGTVGRLLKGLNEMTRPGELLGRLEARHKKTPDAPALAEAVKSLRKRWSGQAGPNLTMNTKAGSFNPEIYRLVADMAELRGHTGAWPIDAVANDAPPRGLRRSYLKTRKLASQPTTLDHLQELVLAIRALDTQLAVIGKAAPTLIKAQRKLLSRAADGYAELHLDNALDRAIHQQQGTRSGKDSRDAKALSEDAAADLTQALAETPTAFMNRIGVYWSVWRRDLA